NGPGRSGTNSSRTDGASAGESERTGRIEAHPVGCAAGRAGTSRVEVRRRALACPASLWCRPLVSLTIHAVLQARVDSLPDLRRTSHPPPSLRRVGGHEILPVGGHEGPHWRP